MTEIEQIKSKINISELISEYIELKRAGAHLKGCCPFHNENTPSFMVSEERQRYHCFGCGADGDIFNFVQDIEGMSFVEALKHLAAKAGVELTESRKAAGQQSEKNRLKEIMESASYFYHNFLEKMEVAGEARDYLKERGLSEESIKKWQVGFAPEQWDLLTKYLLKKGFGIDDIVKTGMTIQKPGANKQNLRGYYDRFRARVMFPISNEHGNVLGFTGRVLVETEKSGGKYVNTPQTPLYDKSRIVFGLYNAKKAIREKDRIVLVEGQMDVIASSQAGLEEVVASSGTALTRDQIKLLSRYSKNMSMAFDMDEAGIKAAKRGIEIALEEGMNLKVIQIPEEAGKDPDDCIQKDPKQWFEAVDNAKEVMAWIIDMALRGRDLQNAKQKQDVVNDVLPFLAQIPYAVERDHWLSELSLRVSVDVSVLREDVKRFASEQKEAPQLRPAKAVEAPAAELKEERIQQTRFDLLLERALEILLFDKELIKSRWALIGRIDKPLSTSKYAELYKSLKLEYNSKEEHSEENGNENEANYDEKTNKLKQVLLMKAELDFLSLSKDELDKELSAVAHDLQKEYKNIRRKELERALSEAESSGDNNKIHELLQELQELL